MVRPVGKTKLFDAIISGLEMMNRAKYTNRSLLILSDGQENSSPPATSDQIKELIRASNVTLYFLVRETTPSLYDKAISGAIEPRPSVLAYNAKESVEKITKGAVVQPIIIRPRTSLGLHSALSIWLCKINTLLGSLRQLADWARPSGTTSSLKWNTQ